VAAEVLGGVAVAALVLAPPLLPPYFLEILISVMLFGYLGAAWNILGGYAGQFSFGHAAFFGIGAYTSTLLFLRLGLSPWLGMLVGGALAAAFGLAAGYLSFRYGLRGPYFALVTLAFAEVARVLIASFEYTGGGFGMLVPLSRGAANFQFADRRVFYLIAWALVAIGCLIAWWLENSRFGAQLIAVRENEDGAQALGVNLVRTKVLAIMLSAAMAATVGVFYVQNFLFVDSHIAFGPAMSIEALLVAIIGGMGTVFGPLIGAVVLHALGEVAKQITGNAPGLNLVLYGLLLIVALRYLPHGFASVLDRRRRKPAPEAADA
jgi:branched-chain amino acid transport system permease protein